MYLFSKGYFFYDVIKDFYMNLKRKNNMNNKKALIKRIFLPIFFTLLLSINNYAMVVENEGPAETNSNQAPQYVPGEVLVKFKEGANPSQVLKAINIETKDISRVHSIKSVVEKFKKNYKLEKNSEGWYPFLGKKYKEANEIPDEEMFKEAYKNMPEAGKALYRSYKLKIPEGVTIEEAVNKLKNDPNVEYAEPNYIAKTFYVPNDPLYLQQWSHQKTQAELGWDIERGNPNVVIAVIDTGVEYNHEDLASNIWKDTDGNPGVDFVDIDTETYVQAGYKLIAGEDYTQIDADPFDYYGHGTHVMGIAGACGGNNIGIAGVAHNCKLMSVRAGFAIKDTYSNAAGLFEYDDIANAIVYAVENGARVINMSFGGSPARTLEDSLNYATSRGVILVAAAGNDGLEMKFYPAAYDNVIAVGATAPDEYPANFSNSGSWVDVVAPGVDIISTVPRTGGLSDPTGYKKLSGTSMACPYVSGLIALLISEQPGMDLNAVKKALYVGAERIYTNYICWDYEYGFGRVNVYKTLHSDASVYMLARIKNPDKGGLRYKQFDGLISIEGTALSSSASPRYTIEIGAGSSPGTWDWKTSGVTLNNSGVQNVVDGSLGTLNSSLYTDGVYTIRLRVYNNSLFDEKKIVLLINNSIHNGWPQGTAYGCSGYLSSPVMADIDNDGSVETVVSGYDAFVYAWHQDGTAVQGWPVYVGNNLVTPSIGDIDGDEYMEIVVGRFSSAGANLFVLRHDGTPFPGNWPKGNGLQNNNEVLYVWQPPTLTDIDNDGDLEIITGDARGHISAWHHTGESVSGWPVGPELVPTQRISQKVTTAVGDVDGDGELEIIAVEANPSGFVYIINTDGTLAHFTQVVGGSIYQPAIGDIDGDNQLEIVINSTQGLCAVNGDGSVVPGWPKVSTEGKYRSLGEGAPALGDLTGDGAPEVILSATRPSESVIGIGILPSKIWVFKGDGSTFGNWPYVFGRPFKIRYETYGAVIANIDADPEQEILVSSYYTPYASMYVVEGNGAPISGYPKIMDVEHNSMPALSDLDNDGKLEIAAFGYWNQAFPTPFYIYDLDISYVGKRMDWPMLGHDPQHTGCYNHAPVLQSIGNKNVNEGRLLDFTVYAADINVNDKLIYSANDLPQGAYFDPQTKTFTWTPTYEQAGVYNATFTVSDGSLIDSETIAITVINMDIIAIELEGSSLWQLNGVRMGELRSNTDANGNFLHKVKNTGSVPVNVEIKYGAVAGEGIQPGVGQGVDVFITKVGGEILLPDGSRFISSVQPGISEPLSFTYGAPTKVSGGVTNMSASYEIRAFLIDTQGNE